MNKRGMTLAEIIISVTLISIVLIFLVKLLTTLRYEQSFTNYEKNNTIARAEIIKTVQTDLIGYKLVDLKDESTNTSAVLHFKFGDVGNTNKYLIIEAEKVSYCATTSCNGSADRIWKLNKSKDDVKYDYKCLAYDYDIDTSSSYYWIKIDIKLDGNFGVDNSIDDLEIFYLGEKGTDINAHIPTPTDLYLGKHTNGECTN